jgi:stearoyl-CoA desaturase (delta-9 desaturase)
MKSKESEDYENISEQKSSEKFLSDFESLSDNNNNECGYKREIVWRNVISLSLLHIGAIYGYCLSLDPSIPWFAFIVVDLIGRFCALGVLAGSHRLWSHRSYKARLPLRVVLMIMQTMSLQNDIYEWCRDHRTHHKFSETDADPHNSRRGFFFAHMGWLLVKKHPQVIRKGKYFL